MLMRNLRIIRDLKLELQLYNQKRADYIKSHRNLLISDYISTEYSRCITIIENAQKKVKEDIDKNKAVNRLNLANVKLQKLRLHSSANLLKVVANKSNLPVGNTPNKNESRPRKDSSDSIIVLNSDRLDLTAQTSMMRKHTDDGFNPIIHESRKYSANNNLKDETDLNDSHDLRLQKSNDTKEMPKQADEISGRLKPQQASPDDKKNQQKVVNRKFVYYDKNCNFHSIYTIINISNDSTKV